MAADTRKVAIYLTYEEQSDLSILAFALTREGVDGLVDQKGEVNRSATIQALIKRGKSKIGIGEWQNASLDLQKATHA